MPRYRTKKSRLSSGLWVNSSTCARCAMSWSGGTGVSSGRGDGSAGEGGAVEELAGGADDARADDAWRGDRAVDDDVDHQVARGVLDVDAGGAGRPAGGELVADGARQQHPGDHADRPEH